MKSKFMKSVQLLWQASPETEANKTVRETEETPKENCSDPALAKEYVRALTEEQIPQPLLEKIAELINGSIPDVVRRSIDKEAEKRNIYDHLLAPFTAYIRFIYEKIQAEGSSQWKQDEARLKTQVKELNDYIRELVSKQEEFQGQYLSAERQKRALGERVHELEMRIVTFEAAKEQSETEKSALNNRLKVAAVQEKNKQDEILALQEEKARIEAELLNLRNIDAALPEKLKESELKVEAMQKELDELLLKSRSESDMLIALQTEKEELKEKLGKAAAEIDELHGSLTTALHAKDDAVLQAVERENALKEKVESLDTEKQRYAGLSDARDAELKESRQRLSELSRQLEELQSVSSALAEEEKARLESALATTQNKLLELQQKAEDEMKKAAELRSETDDLKMRIDTLAKEKEALSVQLSEKDSALESQKALSEQIESSHKESAEAKHQLMAANDVLSAIRTQRQELLAEVEKIRAERTGLQQKLQTAQDVIRQFENEQQIDRRNIKALMSEIEELKNELKNKSQDGYSDEPEELDWLVPTRPDTAEEIARKKAEKKLAEKEAIPGEEKAEVKPDPSQMSLW